MHLAEKGEHDLFLLAVLLIAAVYFIGLSTEGTVLFSGIGNLLRTATAQTATGFKSYPAAGSGGIGIDADVGDSGDIGAALASYRTELATVDPALGFAFAA